MTFGTGAAIYNALVLEATMTDKDSLRARAQRLLADVGLCDVEVIHDVTNAAYFGDSEAIFRIGLIQLRILRLRSQDFVDIGPSGPRVKYYQLGDLELAMGWTTLDETIAKQEPEPLPSVINKLANKYAQLVDAFSEARIDRTLEQLEVASLQRGKAFAERLEALRTKSS